MSDGGLYEAHIFACFFCLKLSFKSILDKKRKHIPFKDGKQFIGTTRYASVGSHLGFELGRKDDIESLGYVLLYMLKGIVPWQKLKSTEKNRISIVSIVIRAVLNPWKPNATLHTRNEYKELFCVRERLTKRD